MKFDLHYITAAMTQVKCFNRFFTALLSDAIISVAAFSLSMIYSHLDSFNRSSSGDKKKDGKYKQIRMST